MRIKKILAGTILSGMCAVFLLFPVHTQAAEESQATTIVTEVPTSHTVKVAIEGQGTVGIDGKTYESTQNIEVGRLKEQEYKITAADGWKLEKVTYGVPGSEEEVTLADSAFTAPALYEDGNVLAVTFVKDTSGADNNPGTGTSGTDTKPGGTGTTGGQTSTGQGVKTGDESQPIVWTFTAVLSLAALLFGAGIRKKRKGHWYE